MIPDAEKSLGEYLREQLAVKVLTRGAPRSIKDPWVRMTLLSDASTDGGIVDRAFDCYMQFDCYSGKDGDVAVARLLAVALRTSIRQLIHIGGQLDDAVVYGADLQMSHLPDTTFEPAMERYTVTGSIWMGA